MSYVIILRTHWDLRLSIRSIGHYSAVRSSGFLAADFAERSLGDYLFDRDFLAKDIGGYRLAS
jgi:hypothetical protein